MDTRTQSKQIVTEAYMDLGLLDEGVLSGMSSVLKAAAKKIAAAAKKSDIVKNLEYSISGMKSQDDEAIEMLTDKIVDMKRNPEKYEGMEDNDWESELRNLERKQLSLQRKSKEELVLLLKGISFIVTTIGAIKGAKVKP
jgi:hypothetical protein